MRKVDKMITIYKKYCNIRVKMNSRKIFADPSIKEILCQNHKFKNIHEGKRCFILGNGPSLKNDNVLLLKDEIVFTVNQIARNPDFDRIKSKYHFWLDPHFFEIDDKKPEDLELLKTMKDIKTSNNSPIAFYPIENRDFVNKYGLDKEIETHFYNTGYWMYEGFSYDIDFTQIIPCSGTVVMSCILMAIYMGFSEIYLLGCDHTGLITTIKSAAKMDVNDSYAYPISSNEKKRMENLLDKVTLSDYVQSYLNTLKQYKWLYDYCSNRGISLVNCSSVTAIDCIPRRPLKEVLYERK